MAQEKIGKLDFYPMTQKIEEVSIFYVTILKIIPYSVNAAYIEGQ